LRLRERKSFLLNVPKNQFCFGFLEHFIFGFNARGAEVFAKCAKRVSQKKYYAAYVTFFFIFAAANLFKKLDI